MDPTQILNTIVGTGPVGAMLIVVIYFFRESLKAYREDTKAARQEFKDELGKERSLCAEATRELSSRLDQHSSKLDQILLTIKARTESK